MTVFLLLALLACGRAPVGDDCSGADIVGDGIDHNCDGVDGIDVDGDGVASEASGGDDCDDTDPESYGGAAEVWYDDVDQACDGDDDWDQDGDGFLLSDDCDDTASAVNPEIIEVGLNGIDDDCDYLVDELTVELVWGEGVVEVIIEGGDPAGHTFGMTHPAWHDEDCLGGGSCHSLGATGGTLETGGDYYVSYYMAYKLSFSDGSCWTWDVDSGYSEPEWNPFSSCIEL